MTDHQANQQPAGAPLRVLFATDGSAPADVARDLLANIEWPTGTVLRVVTAVEGADALFGTPWAIAGAPRTNAYEEDLLRHAEMVLEATARGLARSGATIEREVLRGRPGSVIPQAAADWSADLLAIGSRGHGSIATMLLGSVGAEVIDQARCPVLVGRSRSLTRIVLGHDGSAHARAAEELLTSWPIFSQCAVEVTSVAHMPLAWHAGLSPAMSAEASELYRAGVEQSLREHQQIAGEAAHRLIEAGLRAGSTVSEGSPAAELIRVAVDRQADLVLVATHGRTGFGRVLLGSVARNVLTHAPMSVMVVRTNA